MLTMIWNAIIVIFMLVTISVILILVAEINILKNRIDAVYKALTDDSEVDEFKN